MTGTIDEEMVKDILRERDREIKSIHEKMLSFYQELKSSDSLLEAVALPALQGEAGMPSGKGGHKDLSDVLARYQRQLLAQDEEIRKIMWELAEQEKMVNRVWACFRALEEPYYSILHRMYVENQLYQAVEAGFGMSHKTFEKHRRQGIELVIWYYESGADIAELMRMRRGIGPCRKKNKGNSREKPQERRSETGCGQISIAGYLEGVCGDTPGTGPDCAREGTKG